MTNLNKSIIIVSNETLLEEIGLNFPNDWFLFYTLDEAERSIANRILTFKEVLYKSGDTVLSMGETAHSIAYIAEGCVAVYRDSAQRSVLLNRLPCGSTFGASSLFGKDENFPTHLIAKASTRILFVSQETLESLFSQIPKTAVNYIRFLTDRIRFLNGKIRSFASGTNEEKLARFLLENEDNGKIFVKNLSSLASSLSLGRASLYREIESMTASGLISRSKNTIEILNKQNLERITKQ